MTSTHSTPDRTTNDVSIGILIGVDEKGTALVAFPDSPSDVGLPARSTTHLSESDIGREVALLFESGDLHRPLIIGRIHSRIGPAALPEQAPVAIQRDDDNITFEARREITLKCGNASITLTRAGKVLIRGSYVLSQSTGANRIKGGSIQLN